MKKTDYVEKQIKKIREIWFKDHVAHYESFGEGLNKIERLKWSKPNDSNCCIHYLTSHGCLMVYGDLGEQNYNFYRNELSVKGFNNIDQIHYYISKAHNIDGYCKLEEWVEVFANEWIDECAKFMEIKLPEDYYDDVDDIPNRLAEYLYEACDVDSESAYTIQSAGYSTNMRALSHFVGLVMANEQLNKF